MKIAVLGATGATGIRFVKEALAVGHDVVAVVRNPDKLKDVKDERLKVNLSFYSDKVLLKSLVFVKRL